MKKNIFVCAVCEVLFNSRTVKKYCSEHCTRISKLRAEKVVKQTLTCLYCGEVFTTERKNKQCCSSVCTSRYFRAKNPKSYEKLYTVSRFKIFARDNFQCIYCGKSSIEDKQELHLEHIYPRSKGGNNNVNNLVTSCKVCNLEKSARELNKDILERIYKVVKERNVEYFKGIDTKELEAEFDKMYKYESIKDVEKIEL